MTDHNRMAGNCLHQSARATDDQVCHVQQCLDENPVELFQNSKELPAMNDFTSKQELMDAFDNGDISYSTYKVMEEDFDV